MSLSYSFGRGGHLPTPYLGSVATCDEKEAGHRHRSANRSALSGVILSALFHPG